VSLVKVQNGQLIDISRFVFSVIMLVMLYYAVSGKMHYKLFSHIFHFVVHV